ncbi:MAG TPA: hypothetical protein VE954_11125 [Oligoflexus sp.]|uniref:hypothetical protein n=1 Tax=Oligoflexus sp. TaxID=1971216 RepID=UPI002D22D8EA|nr:hypothetical protein [Oligoflexus sp.]HYX33658.1 hypothetical protein [Oligoflexus sp.]
MKRINWYREPDLRVRNMEKGLGRPAGFSPKAKETSTVLQEDGEYVVIRVQKKQLMKLLLKDLI